MSIDTSDAATSSEVDAAIEDLFDPANRHDPYGPANRLRTLGPVHRTRLGPSLITGFDDGFAVLSDVAWSHAGESSMLHDPEESEEAAQERGLMAKTFVWMDPPDHTRLRGLVVRAFTPRVVSSLRPRVEEIVTGLLDRVVGEGEFDLISELAYPLPLTVIGDLLGMPAADHPGVQDLSQHLARGFDPDTLMTREERASRRTSAKELFLYFRGLLNERHRNPGTDLLSRLAAVEVEGDVLSETELLATCVTMLVAGHETTVNLMGNGLLALMRNPDQFQLLREQPGLAAPAVDELLRYDPSVQMTTRTATRALTVSGHEFAPGDGVIVMLNSGNRDPRRFTDPDRLDLARFQNTSAPRPRHLSFGWGIHYCMGVALAVLQAEVLLQQLASRVSAIEQAGEPDYRPNLFFRGMRALPARFLS